MVDKLVWYNRTMTLFMMCCYCNMMNFRVVIVSSRVTPHYTTTPSLFSFIQYAPCLYYI